MRWTTKDGAEWKIQRTVGSTIDIERVVQIRNEIAVYTVEQCLCCDGSGRYLKAIGEVSA